MISHRVFLTISQPREALRTEIDGILPNGSNSIPGALLVRLNDPAYAKFQNTDATAAVKLKPNKGYKIRLRIRGDPISPINQAFSTDPTANREMLEMSPMIFVNRSDFVWSRLGISNACAQSGYLGDADRAIVRLPPFIGLSSLACQGRISFGRKLSDLESTRVSRRSISQPTVSKDIESNRVGLLFPRPLYGTRDAPLRWPLKTSSILRGGNFAPPHRYHFIFCKRENARRPTAL